MNEFYYTFATRVTFQTKFYFYVLIFQQTFYSIKQTVFLNRITQKS